MSISKWTFRSVYLILNQNKKFAIFSESVHHLFPKNSVNWYIGKFSFFLFEIADCGSES